jgi:hypothetical protein
MAKSVREAVRMIVMRILQFYDRVAHSNYLYSLVVALLEPTANIWLK